MSFSKPSQSALGPGCNSGPRFSDSDLRSRLGPPARGRKPARPAGPPAPVELAVLSACGGTERRPTPVSTKSCRPVDSREAGVERGHDVGVLPAQPNSSWSALRRILARAAAPAAWLPLASICSKLVAFGFRQADDVSGYGFGPRQAAKPPQHPNPLGMSN